MSQNLLSNIVRVSTGFLNTVNDAQPGQTVAGTAGLNAGAAPGQLGGLLVCSAIEAARLSTTYTLYAGAYQYVKFYLSSSAPNKRGGPLYWQDRDNYVVTPDVPTGVPDFAGVGLMVNTKGYYGFIQVAGKVACAALDNTTKATPAIGDNLILSTAGRFDDIADATAFDGTNLKLAVGQWLEAPADGTDVLYLANVEWKNPNY